MEGECAGRVSEHHCLTIRGYFSIRAMPKHGLETPNKNNAHGSIETHNGSQTQFAYSEFSIHVSVRTWLSSLFHTVVLVVVLTLANIARVASSFFPVELKREFQFECLLHFIEITNCVDLHRDLLPQSNEGRPAVKVSTCTKIQHAIIMRTWTGRTGRRLFLIVLYI